MCERMSLCLALGQTGSWSDWRWHATSLAAKTSFYFCPCNCCSWGQASLAKCRSRGLCAAPDETIVESKEWQATSANLRDRVQPGSQLQGSWHTCYKFPWPAHSLGATLGVGSTYTQPQSNPHNPHSRPIESKPAARLSL